jgi:predicted transcriptional regulator
MMYTPRAVQDNLSQDILRTVKEDQGIQLCLLSERLHASKSAVRHRVVSMACLGVLRLDQGKQMMRIYTSN